MLAPLLPIPPKHPHAKYPNTIQMKNVTIQSLISKANRVNGDKAYDLTMQILQERYAK